MCLGFTGVEVHKGRNHNFRRGGTAGLTGPWPVPLRRRCGATVRDLFRRAFYGRGVAAWCEWHWGLLRQAAAAVRARLCLWAAVPGWPAEAGLPTERDRSGE